MVVLADYTAVFLLTPLLLMIKRTPVLVVSSDPAPANDKEDSGSGRFLLPQKFFLLMIQQYILSRCVNSRKTLLAQSTAVGSPYRPQVTAVVVLGSS